MSMCRNQFLDAFQGQLMPIIAIVLLRIVVTVGTWMLGIFGRRTTNKQVRDSGAVAILVRRARQVLLSGLVPSFIAANDIEGATHAFSLQSAH